MHNILIGKANFKDWTKRFIFLRDKYPNNIFLHDFLNEENILKLINQYNITLIIPICFEDMELLSKSNIPCKYLSPKNYNDILLMDNKCTFFKYFIDNNLQQYIPETYVIKSPSINYYKEIKYPSIQKSNIGYGGCNIFILHSDKDIKKLDDYIIQEYIIDNNEYACHFICMEGKIIFHKILKEIHNKEFYIQRGPMNDFEIIDFDISGFEFIFKKINYTGAGCINFKYINNQIYIFEVNPRFGGTLILNYLFIEFFDNIFNITNYI